MATAVVVEGWVDTGLGYELTLAEGKLVCRNGKGRILASVPPRVRASDAAENLLSLREWLASHEARCRTTVEEWMLRSLPIPSDLIIEVWPDPAWRSPLEHAVVAAGGVSGFLRAAEATRGIGLVDLEGETVWTAAPTVTIHHPVLIDPIDDFREFAAELGVGQGLAQVMREIYRKPEELDPKARSVRTYAAGSYPYLGAVTTLCERHGLAVRGGNVICGVWEAGRFVEARVWMNASHDSVEIGELTWVDDSERPLCLAEVGPVAYSEGVRIAAIVHAGARTR